MAAKTAATAAKDDAFLKFLPLAAGASPERAILSYSLQKRLTVERRLCSAP